MDNSSLELNSDAVRIKSGAVKGGAGISVGYSAGIHTATIDLADNSGLKLGTGSGTPSDTDKLSVNYGGGLTIDSSGTNVNKLRVDYNTVASTLAPTNDTTTGLTNSSGKLSVKYGSGLTLSAGELSVNTAKI